MRNCGKVTVRAIVQLLLFSVSGSAFTQTTDSTYIISSTEEQLPVSPISRSDKPFYDIIRPDREGLRPTVLYSSDDRIYVGVNYNAFSDGWYPDSLGQKHQVYTHYSINQKAFSVGYKGIFNQLIGKWNLFVDANYDWERWMNFYGLGNETIQQTDNRDFYRIRSREALLSVSLQHKLGKQSRISVTPFYQQIQLVRDEGRFLSKTPMHGLGTYQANNFIGLRSDLYLQRVNDLILPTKGVIFSTGVAYVQNISQSRFITNYNAYTRIFLPFLNHFVLSVENGAATLFGEPEFYQLNSIGGNTLRGYRRERFWGETIFHNNNELQYLFNAPSKLFKGKLGLLAFVDQGRVWKKGERSDSWHYGYGGGIIVVPYRKLYLSLQYGISNERKGIHLEFRRSL